MQSILAAIKVTFFFGTMAGRLQSTGVLYGDVFSRFNTEAFVLRVFFPVGRAIAHDRTVHILGCCEGSIFQVSIVRGLTILNSLAAVVVLSDGNGYLGFCWVHLDDVQFGE